MKKDELKKEETNIQIEKETEKVNNETQNKSKIKKKRTINGISIWRI